MTPEQGARFKQATQAIDQGQFGEGIRLLQELDLEVDDFAVNRQLARALFEDQRFVEAYQVAERHLADYDQSRQLADFYVQLALKNQLFIPARQFISLATHLTDAEGRLVKRAEEQYDRVGAQTLASRRRQFIHMGDCSFREQQRRFSEGRMLPLSDYLVGAKFLLRDPDTHPLIKSSLVQVLQQLRLNEELTVLWLDEKEHPLNIKELKPLGELTVVKEGERLIAARFADQDPLSYQTYLREFHLQLAFLYPFVELAIEDPDTWVQALVAYSASGNEEPILRAHQWQERINALVTRLS